MQFADFRLKSIQEAVNTAPQGYVDLSHLQEGGMTSGGSYDDPMADPYHQQAMARAKAWQDEVVNSPGGEGNNEEEDDDKD